MVGKNQEQEFVSLGTAHVANIFTEDATAKTWRILQNTQDLKDAAQQWTNTPKAQAQGHIFEHLEAAKFNIDALSKESDLYASVTAAEGLPHAPSDINIMRGILRERFKGRFRQSRAKQLRGLLQCSAIQNIKAWLDW